MLKLFKYNWLRNSTIFYATITVLLLFQAALIIAVNYWNAIDSLIFAMSVFGFTTGALLLFIQVSKTYSNNLKSYNRRLLPVSPWKEIGALLLLQLIYVVVFTAILVMVYSILLPKISFIDMDNIWGFFDAPLLSIVSLVYGLWASINSIIFVMLAIAIAFCFKSRYRVWIGIVSFSIIIGVISYISELLFGKSSSAGLESVSTSQEFSFFVSQGGTKWVPFEIGFDVITTLLAIYAMTYLMSKKIEL
ncbi:MAG TPA: hypothetical protein IAA29_09850 [Candidatus Paenibacillus intestinavium]|nr:hypothetical protein [Candidatus Paenibacillus intestinavium]